MGLLQAGDALYKRECNFMSLLATISTIALLALDTIKHS